MNRNRMPLIVLLALFTGTALAEWSTDPLVNTLVHDHGSAQALPLVSPAADGDTYLAWLSVDPAASNYYTVRLQRFNSEGDTLWAAGGILVSDAPTSTWVSDWDMTVDHDDHAILVYSDMRQGSPTIAAFRVSPAGELIWGEDGIAVSETGLGGYSPVTAVTSDGGLIVAWGTSDLTQNHVIVQRISPEGSGEWGSGVVLDDASLDTTLPALIPSNDGAVMVVYSTTTSGWPVYRYLHAQKISADGETTWPEPVNVCGTGGLTIWDDVPVISDNAGGTIVCWTEDRNSDMNADAWVQHLDTDGVPTMPVNGSELTINTTRHHFTPHPVWLEESEDLIVFWEEDNSNQDQGAIYAQKLDLSGERFFGDEGLALQDLHTDFDMIDGAHTLAGDGAVCFFEEYTTGSVVNSHLLAVSLDPTGAEIWEEPALISSVNSEKLHVFASAYSNDQWVVAWEDMRSGGGDIYAQNLNADGTLGVQNQPSGIAGQVVLEGGDGNVEEVAIQVDDLTVFPDTSGDYFIGLDPGTYAVTATLEGYFPDTQSDIDVMPGTVTPDVDFHLIYDDQVAAEATPSTTELLHIYPNPFNPVTTISFTLGQPARVTLDIYNLSGERVQRLSHGRQSAGKHELIFSGAGLPTGVYICNLVSGTQKTAKRLLLIR